MKKDMGAICSQGHLSHLRSELLWSRLVKKSILYLSVLVFQTLHQIAKVSGFYPGIKLIFFTKYFFCSQYLLLSKNWIFDLSDVFCSIDVWNFHFQLRIFQIGFTRLLLKFMHMIFLIYHCDLHFFSLISHPFSECHQIAKI